MVLVLIGALWLLERTGAIDISVTAVLALATVVIGISLMLLARDGPHVGLIVLGSVLALAAWITAVAPFEGFQGGIGDRTVVVDTVDAIRPDYNVAMGKLTLDLAGMDDIEAATRLTASVGMGELLIRVPEGTAVAVEATVGAGQIQIFDRVVDGVGLDETYQSPGFDETRGHLSLELEVFTGRVEVTDG
jgi:predicted membrane protein